MSDKIHPPTPRKRQQAKEQGRGPRSAEVVSSALLLSATGVLSWIGPSLVDHLLEGITNALRQPTVSWSDSWQPYRAIVRAILGAGLTLMPLAIVILGCGTGVHVLQNGFRIHAQKLVPSVERLSPLVRLQTMFRIRSLGGFAITLMKLLTLSTVFLFFMRETLPALLRLPGTPLESIGPTIFQAFLDCCWWTGATMLAFACVDYALSWWQFERDLMMTEQELREEIRDMQRAQVPATTARSQAVQGVS